MGSRFLRRLGHYRRPNGRRWRFGNWLSNLGVSLRWVWLIDKGDGIKSKGESGEVR